jgi:antitoxin (DNA-binding transcriptional repressor) of toxin-antitoxin stability system
MYMKKLKITEFRRNMFTYFNDSIINGESIEIEKGGIPIARIVPYYIKRDLHGKTFEQVLDAARGSWANDKDWDKFEKKRRKIELEATKKNREEW